MSNQIYEMITDRIVGLLEKGVVPWQQPWSAEQGMPKNLVSGKEYRGVNPFLLASLGFKSPYFLSFKQAADLGGNVKKGEKGCPVVFWKRLKVKEDDGTTKQIPLLRYYTVFNSSQCEGLESKLPSADAPKPTHETIAAAESIANAMPKRPEVKSGQGRAFYSPAQDFVGMPDLADFRAPEDYYNTLFHEFVHSTGHESRLARKGVSGTDGEWSAFGSTPYAREELVAELGAAFICGHAGIVEQTILPSASYLQSWIARLKEDPKLIVNASANAQKAADFILNRKFESQD